VNRSSRNGDLPGIIGSFSAKLVAGKWKIAANKDDVIKQEADFPAGTDFTGLITKVRDKLSRATGYTLRRRPVGLEGINYPTGGRNPDRLAEGQKKIYKIIEDAEARGEINTTADTGFDIVWP